MTANQINYQRNLIQQRANAEQERTNRANENIQTIRNLETQRHNLSTELQASNELSESRRHNIAGEELGRNNLAESVRHNLAGEQETKRHNVADESERHRSNIANETIESNKLAESIRHNMVGEVETQRHNQVSESVERTKAETGQYNAETNRLNAQENMRHNFISETIIKQNNEINWAQTARGLQLKNDLNQITRRYNDQRTQIEQARVLLEEALNSGKLNRMEAETAQGWVDAVVKVLDLLTKGKSDPADAIAKFFQFAQIMK